MKGDLDVALPVNSELVPVLLMKGSGGRKRAGGDSEDIGLEHAEDFCGRGFVCRVERQSLGARNLPGQSCELALPARHRQHARAIADAGLHNLPSDATAAPDHDHGLACQGEHVVLLLFVWAAADAALIGETGAGSGIHRWRRDFFESKTPTILR